MAATMTEVPTGSAQALASAYSGSQRRIAMLVVALAFAMDLSVGRYR